MAKLYNLARMTTATTGTGTITLGAAVSGCLTFAQAGIADQDVVWYGIADGSNGEVGYGTYTSVGTTLTRNPYKSTNSNAAISLSGTAQVFICPVSADGGDMLPTTSNPMRGFDMPINLQINASVATNLLTVAVKGNNGADPSQTNPVLIPFRDPTAANGGPVWLAITSALSINTNATGATLGSVNATAFRFWVVCFNNAGTPVLALINCSTASAIYPLNEGLVASSTAISGTATSAGVFYTPNGTTVTSKPFRILGYIEYNSTGLATAGTYASAPNFVQLFGPGVKQPGDCVQAAQMTTTTDTAVSTTTFTSTALTLAITPTSAANLIEYDAILIADAITQNVSATSQMFRGSTAIGPMSITFSAAGGDMISTHALAGLDAPNTAASVTYTVKGKSASTSTVHFVEGSPAIMKLKEIMG